MWATEQSQAISARFAALGNGTRLEIYRVLVRAGESGLPVASIQSRVDIPASTLSHHLRRLLEVGLVAQERVGTTLLCRADYGVMQTTFAVFAAECCADDARSPSGGNASPDPCC